MRLRDLPHVQAVEFIDSASTEPLKLLKAVVKHAKANNLMVLSTDLRWRSDDDVWILTAVMEQL